MFRMRRPELDLGDCSKAKFYQDGDSWKFKSILYQRSLNEEGPRRQGNKGDKPTERRLSLT